MRRLGQVTCILAVLGLAAPAAAQQLRIGPAVDAAAAARDQAPAPAPRRPAAAPGPKTPIGVRAVFLVDMQQMAAKETFKAVVDSSTMMGFGAAVDITGLYQGLFARFAFATSSKEGSRVFVDDQDEVHSLNIPITVKMMPIDLGAGWRMGGMGKTKSITPYVGGGIVLLGFKETSDIGDDDENVSERFNGFSIFGGVDFAVGKMLTFGVEGIYRTVPNAIGEGGVSEHFKETDLGGLGVRFMIGIRK
jgi:opacity protein-like surface antigen